MRAAQEELGNSVGEGGKERVLNLLSTYRPWLIQCTREPQAWVKRRGETIVVSLFRQAKQQVNTTKAAATATRAKLRELHDPHESEETETHEC